MAQTAVRISEEAHKKMRLICLATGITQKQFIDQAVENQLKLYLQVTKKLREADDKQMQL